MPLFEVAVIKKPTKKEVEENNAVETLALAPEFVVAKDSQSAALKVISKNAASLDLDHSEVLVRPFA